MSSLQNESPFNGDENKIEKSQEHSNQSFETTQPVEVQAEEVPLTSECIHWMPEDESKLDLVCLCNVIKRYERIRFDEQ